MSDYMRTYSRRQTIEVGGLLDVTEQAGPGGMVGGFAVPVAVTAALLAAIEAIPERLVGIADLRGRLHDVLWMAAVSARRARPSHASFASFALRMPRRGTRNALVQLVVAIGPGDDGGPVVTIGFPEDM